LVPGVSHFSRCLCVCVLEAPSQSLPHLPGPWIRVPVPVRGGERVPLQSKIQNRESKIVLEAPSQLLPHLPGPWIRAPVPVRGGERVPLQSKIQNRESKIVLAQIHSVANGPVRQADELDWTSQCRWSVVGFGGLPSSLTDNWQRTTDVFLPLIAHRQAAWPRKRPKWTARPTPSGLSSLTLQVGRAKARPGLAGRGPSLPVIRDRYIHPDLGVAAPINPVDAVGTPGGATCPVAPRLPSAHSPDRSRPAPPASSPGSNSAFAASSRPFQFGAARRSAETAIGGLATAWIS